MSLAEVYAAYERDAGVRLPTEDECRAARARVYELALVTPLVPIAIDVPPHTSSTSTLSLPSRAWLKLECFQRGRSFKTRGVYYACALAADEDARTPARERRRFVTVSAGNTALAVALAARALGHPCTGIMPVGASAVKRERCAQLGMQCELRAPGELFPYMLERHYERERDRVAFVHAWHDWRVMAGHASLAYEVLEQCPGVRSVFVPVGGGGLLCGVAPVFKRAGVRVYACEPAALPRWLHLFPQAAASPECTVVEGAHTACDGLMVPCVTKELAELARSGALQVDRVVPVSEEDVLATQRQLALECNVVVEPSAAISVAACRLVDEDERGVSVCLLTGGNVLALPC